MPSESRNADSYAECAEFYDLVDPYRNRKDVEFFVQLAKESNGPVLEAGCGTGRVLLPTARAGVEIAGLDLSHAMLDLCRRKVDTEPEAVRRRIQLLQGDMRDFTIERTFALVTLPFRPFQHLETVADQLACLACLRRHLAPNGRLVLDIFNPKLESIIDESRKEGFGHEPEVALPDGRRMRRWARVPQTDRFGQLLHCELIYEVTHPDGRAERLVDTFKMRYLFRYEAEHLLARAGFTVEALYSGYDKSPYGAKDPGELIFVARRVD